MMQSHAATLGARTWLLSWVVAVFRLGDPRYWNIWNEALKDALIRSQRSEGHARGSWDPVGPWGFAGGRIYTTALLALCLETYFRHEPPESLR